LLIDCSTDSVGDAVQKEIKQTLLFDEYQGTLQHTYKYFYML